MRPLFAAIALLPLTNSFAQEIPNGGFEDWTTEFLFETTDAWRTGNGESSGVINTTRISDAPEGESAVRLETVWVEGEPEFGFILLGDIDDEPTGGVPFSTDVQSLTCWMRYSMIENDSALVLLTIWSNGNGANREWRFGGEQLEWTEVTLTSPFTVLDVDSVTVAFASSDPFFLENAMGGSWLEVDDVRLTAPTAIEPDLLPNNGFENWSDVELEDPDNWGTFNRLTLSLGLTPVTKSLQASTGNYCARIESLGVDGDVLPGIVSTGDPENISSGIPYVNEPQLLIGAYQFLPNGTDTATIGTVFKSNGVVIGSAQVQITEATIGWAGISEAVVLGGTPDTLVVVISSGNNAGSVLLVDDLDLLGGNVGLTELQQESALPYPNPTNDQLSVPGVQAGDRAAIVDGLGRVVRSLSFTDTGVAIVPVADLASGQYVLSHTSNGRTVHHNFLKTEK